MHAGHLLKNSFGHKKVWGRKNATRLSDLQPSGSVYTYFEVLFGQKESPRLFLVFQHLNFPIAEKEI